MRKPRVVVADLCNPQRRVGVLNRHFRRTWEIHVRHTYRNKFGCWTARWLDCGAHGLRDSLNPGLLEMVVTIPVWTERPNLYWLGRWGSCILRPHLRIRIPRYGRRDCQYPSSKNFSPDVSIHTNDANNLRLEAGLMFWWRGAGRVEWDMGDGTRQDDTRMRKADCTT